jgi:hypothetical protein
MVRRYNLKRIFNPRIKNIINSKQTNNKTNETLTITNAIKIILIPIRIK